MSSHKEQLQPTPFDVVQPRPVEPATTVEKQQRESGTPRWVLPALGGLLLLATVLLYLIYSWLVGASRLRLS